MEILRWMEIMTETNSHGSPAQLKAENAQAASQAEAEKACAPVGIFTAIARGERVYGVGGKK
jgi:hypothetical protein